MRIESWGLDINMRILLCSQLGVALVALLSFSLPLSAEPALYLSYHDESGVNDAFFVGGMLENKGVENIYQGYIVITPLTKNCYPVSPQLWRFSGIEIGRKQRFKIPIRGNLSNYKLDLIHAVDSFGNKIKVIDTVSSTIRATEDDYLEKCKKARIYHR